MGYAAGSAGAPAITDINPMGTDGFEFVEYTSPNPDDLDRLFTGMGFARATRGLRPSSTCSYHSARAQQ